MSDQEVLSQSAESTAAPESTPVEGSSGDSSSNQAQTQTQDQAPKTFREKIAAKASEKAKSGKSESASLPPSTPQGSTNPASQGSAEAAALAEAKKYNPNFKFSSYGKEHEFDEFVRGAIKDKETEDKVRDLYTRAYALNDMKGKLEKTRGEFNTIVSNLKNLDTMVNKGDLQSFFQAIGMNDDVLKKYVLQRLQYADMSPEQRQAFDAQREQAMKLAQAERLNADLQTQREEAMVDLRVNQLDNVMDRPEIKNIAEKFDQRLGSGSFRNRVIRQGQLLFHATGRDHSPAEVVKSLVEDLGLELGNPQAQSQPAPVQQAPRPTLPHVSGKATSPTKQPIKSLKQVRELVANMGD